MKTLLVLIAAFFLFSSAGRAGFWPIEKEIPEDLCGTYEKVGEILTNGGKKNTVAVSGVVFSIEAKRILRLGCDEIMEVETVLTVTKKGKTSSIVAFKDSSISWILAESDTPSQLAVVQNDEKEHSRSQCFVLERRAEPPATKKHED